MAAALATFKLDKVDKSGTTWRATLRQLWKTTGKKPKGLTPPKLPTLAALPFEWWKELNRARTCSELGLNPLSFESIRAWSEIRRITLDPFDLTLIQAIDRAYLQVFNQRETDNG
jgi:hypothetical protein